MTEDTESAIYRQQTNNTGHKLSWFCVLRSTGVSSSNLTILLHHQTTQQSHTDSRETEELAISLFGEPSVNHL